MSQGHALQILTITSMLTGKSLPILAIVEKLRFAAEIKPFFFHQFLLQLNYGNFPK
jgi:hypothetical protein